MAKSKDTPKLVKMAELSRLSGVPGPTIKHYIREGLLPEPAKRTSKNMAYYDARLADRIRAIKTMQQEHYLPLKVIGQVLEPAPSAQPKKKSLKVLDTYIPAIRAGQKSTSREEDLEWMSASQVVRKFRVDMEELDWLEEKGVVSSSEYGRSKRAYSGPSLKILGVVDQLRRQNLEDWFPLEVLLPYMEAVRVMVRFELDLFRRQVLEMGLEDREQIFEVGSKAIALGESLLVAMRNELMLPEIDVLNVADADDE